MAVQKDLKKKIQIQNMIIIALAIVIFVLLFVSGTAAWYIRTKSDSADIILSDPVNIYIAVHEQLKDASGNPVLDKDGNPILKYKTTDDILDGASTRVYPGDRIRLSLGVQIGTQKENEIKSSPAYVRVKLAIIYENIITHEFSSLDDVEATKMIKYDDKPDTTIWRKVDFNQFKKDENGNSVDPDEWFVLYEIDNDGDYSAKTALNGETYPFLRNGYIHLDKLEITNAQANCKFHIQYIVEAIQVPHVPNPLKEIGKGPWWDFALGDID